MSIRHPTFAISHYARLASLIDIPQIVGAGFKSTLGEVGFNHFREETSVLELFQRDPFDPDLLFVMLAAGADTIWIGQKAAENVLHLMEGTVRMAKFMVFAYIFPHIKQFADFDRCADFFQAFALQALAQCFAVALSAARKDVKDASLITHLDRE